jgi:hypothetical protein
MDRSLLFIIAGHHSENITAATRLPGFLLSGEPSSSLGPPVDNQPLDC